MAALWNRVVAKGDATSVRGVTLTNYARSGVSRQNFEANRMAENFLAESMGRTGLVV